MSTHAYEAIIQAEDILKAHQALRQVISPTPLQRNDLLSKRFNCEVYLKREDLQVVRSFKIRGAYNKIINLSPEERANGIVCASAGNHAQGVAYSCMALGIRGTIFMPQTTPKQKITQVKLFGGEHINIQLIGDTFDEAAAHAMEHGAMHGMTFIHPFDDPQIIAGQGTVGYEMLEQSDAPVDYVFATIGGGGLAAGLSVYVNAESPATRIIGVEPESANGMQVSISEGQVTMLETIDSFVDGAAVKKVGQLTYDICSHLLDDIVTVPNGKVCSTILELYNSNAIVMEPAGALPVAALESYKDKIEGKRVVCVISGSNNDIDRLQDFKEKSLIYEGLKHYFIINFPQRAGALRSFLEDVLGPNDDITRFEYIKKTFREHGPALVGIELKYPHDYEPLIKRLADWDQHFIAINKDHTLFGFLV
ncbi:threonine dehydratase [Paenibacillus swuensis]|uniref:L-threonine dehydratase n=1 Tax=Paenibacillus swuensis TaxID=1178515 RepID=A0A172TFJ5_9BACL|nr:threonine ammonia-lyase IlvA [Paenibacillus swuensis]ANE45674.1 threonine dehydratase [Paenibacillus swuensis]